MDNLATAMITEKAQSPAPPYPGLPSNPSQTQSAYTPPTQPPSAQGYPAQHNPGQQPALGQYCPPQHPQYPSGQYAAPIDPPGAQPQFNSSPGTYAQGSIGPQSGFQTAPQTMYTTGPGAQYQQQLYAMCAQGNHDITTKYGVVGIITAIFCFPIGLLALLVDKEYRCVRCGARVNV